MLKKKLFIFSCMIIFFILLLFFLKFNYKKINLGNNKNNKSASQIKELVFNISSYDAQIEVVVESNKNSNKYMLKQKYKRDCYEEQIVLKPECIEGLKMSYSDGVLKIDNSKYNLSKIYEGYPYLSSNVLCLSSFIEDCKKDRNSVDFFEDNNQFVFSLKSEKNKYLVNRLLYVEKGTGIPKKMVVQDYNNKNVIYILYNEIDLNI